MTNRSFPKTDSGYYGQISFCGAVWMSVPHRQRNYGLASGFKTAVSPETEAAALALQTQVAAELGAVDAPEAVRGHGYGVQSVEVATWKKQPVLAVVLNDQNGPLNASRSNMHRIGRAAALLGASAVTDRQTHLDNTFSNYYATSVVLIYDMKGLVRRQKLAGLRQMFGIALAITGLVIMYLYVSNP